MRRERVQLSPVFYTALENPSSGAKDVGYVRLTQFSNNAADDMKAAIQDLEVGGGEGSTGARGGGEAGGPGEMGMGKQQEEGDRL